MSAATTKTSPDCCPFCGAGFYNREAARGASGEYVRKTEYKCGSGHVSHQQDVTVFRSSDCAYVIEQRLTRERDEVFQKLTEMAFKAGELTARVQRLEVAGDAMWRKAGPFIVRSVCLDEEDWDTEVPIRELDPGLCIRHEEPPTAGEIVELIDAVDGWTKAKEAQP